MSRLQALLVEAKKGLEPWQRIPAAAIPLIAARCGAAEFAEIHERIAALKAELAETETWDGDTRDDIHRAIAFFTSLAAGAPQR